ncbi:nuclear transport factor 2 family protein [Embleya sp. NBC_00896]|uniref:nuclear transport factor 2 family protein n=1 Tax=Embleya sp. NBC_00896 TaxID=2975961 RepID=UPI003865E146|nr:nuclear transport factor 2 family protein [Embleya sp. NBC_00896]
MTSNIDFTALAERYISTWNETDPAARRKLVEAVYTEDAAYVDPLVSAEGHDAIDATLGAVQGQFAGLVFTLGGPVDGHHDLARFTWNLGPVGEEAIVVGFDVIHVAEDGRIARVSGFLDKVPAGL